jgi:hypothetical protein
VHDTVRNVLSDPAFRRSVRRTLLDRIFTWLFEWWNRLTQAVRHMPSLRTLGLALVAIVVLFLVVRLIFSAKAERAEASARRHQRDATLHEDPWAVAEALRNEGRYEEAAHALYRGVLNTIARTERVRLDPARTAGDYARELRRKGSGSTAMFRAFTRRFESAVYGHERCTRDVLEELVALSTPFRPRARAA